MLHKWKACNILGVDVGETYDMGVACMREVDLEYNMPDYTKRHTVVKVGDRVTTMFNPIIALTVAKIENPIVLGEFAS